MKNGGRTDEPGFIGFVDGYEAALRNGFCVEAETPIELTLFDLPDPIQDGDPTTDYILELLIIYR